MGTQPDWKWCGRCSSLAYSGFGDGVCVGGQGHDFGGSGPYVLSMDESPAGTQQGWRWCGRCQCLFYSWSGDETWCAAGGQHDGAGSREYSVPLDSVPDGAQEGWRWCAQCQCLAYAHADPAGSCPTGGTHFFAGSGAYSVPVEPPRPVPLDVRADLHPGVIRIEGSGFTPYSTVTIRFLADRETYDVVTESNQIGHILHREDSRPRRGRCTLTVRDTATGRWTMAAVINHVPRALPGAGVPIDPGTALGEEDGRYG